MKYCKRCGRTLTVDQFYNDKGTKDKLTCYCKDCHKEYAMKRRHELRATDEPAFRAHNAEIIRRYRKTPRGVYQSLKFNAKHKGAEFNLTSGEFVGWLMAQPEHCHYCEHSFRGKPNDMRALTIDRKDCAAGYDKQNIVLACRRCNTAKGSWFTEGQMLEIAKHYLRG